MSGLLDEVLTAYGGLERWRAVTALTAHGTSRRYPIAATYGSRTATASTSTKSTS